MRTFLLIGDRLFRLRICRRIGSPTLVLRQLHVFSLSGLSFFRYYFQSFRERAGPISALLPLIVPAPRITRLLYSFFIETSLSLFLFLSQPAFLTHSHILPACRLLKIIFLRNKCTTKSFISYNKTNNNFTAVTVQLNRHVTF